MKNAGNKVNSNFIQAVTGGGAKQKNVEKSRLIMKKGLFIFLIFSFLGCTNDSINLYKVNRIIVKPINKKSNIYFDSIIVINQNKIDRFIDILEQSKREPIKFIADYQVKIYSKDTILILLVHKNLINHRGITYKLKNDLTLEIE